MGANGARGRKSYQAAATSVRALRAGGAGGLGEGRQSRGGGCGGPGAAAQLGSGRRRMRGEASFLAAGGEKCSCPCAPAGGATSGAARGGAGCGRGGGPAAAPPDPLRIPDPFREKRTAGMESEGNTVAGAGGRPVKIRKIPAVPTPTPHTSRSDSPAGGQEGVSEEPRSPGQSRMPGVLPLQCRGAAPGRRTRERVGRGYPRPRL